MALLLGALASGARAQGPAPAPAPAVDEVAESDALILQGVKLREQGRDEEALKLFVRAQEIAPTPRALAQRALAEQAIGDWVQAELHLREALRASDDSWIALHRAALEGALGVISEHLGDLQINGGVGGAQLRLDGQPVGQLPLAAPLRVVVGRPLLEVALAGYYTVRREITIKAGSLSTETIELVPMPARPVAVAASSPQPAGSTGAAQAPSEPSRLDTLPPFVFWTAAGVTAVVGGLALWSGLNASAKNDAYEDYAAQPGATSDEAHDGYEDAKSAQARTNVLLVTTGVAAAATIAIGALFTDWSGSSESDAAASSSALHVAPYSDGTDHGVVLNRRF